jgi:hypothetical protein
MFFFYVPISEGNWPFEGVNYILITASMFVHGGLHGSFYGPIPPREIGVGVRVSAIKGCVISSKITVTETSCSQNCSVVATFFLWTPISLLFLVSIGH